MQMKKKHLHPGSLAMFYTAGCLILSLHTYTPETDNGLVQTQSNASPFSLNSAKKGLKCLYRSKCEYIEAFFIHLNVVVL